MRNFHFKIITTIKLASELKKKYPQYHFVPVFWMASEDHDFAEINHAYIFNKKYEWQLDSEQNPVGRLTLETINDVIEQVKALASTEESRRIVDQYTTPYLESVNLAEATLKLVHSLFKEEGLVVIEPDNKVLKQEFVPIVWKDIIERQNFECLKQTNIEIKAAHYKPQINGREINFFYFSDSGRKLIKYEDGKYLILDTDLVFSPEQMQEELRHYPERFSPNVAMRPLYQETILPNLAYIGGPGELAYWLQLKRMFHHNEIPFPVLQMRETYIIAGKPFVGKVEKAGLTVTELLKPDNELIKCFLEKALVKDVKRIAAQVGDLLQELIDEAKKADALLGSEFIKYKAEQSKYMARLTKQLAEKQKEQHQQGVDKVLKLKQSVLPDGKLQERYINILSLEINGGFCIKKEMMKTAFTCLPEVKVIY